MSGGGVLLGACFLLCACESSSGVELHCPGDRPAIDDCFTGRSFAECGGDGDPLYACGGPSERDCRWFVAGCVAEGYLASSCPSDDLCCEDGFPFSIRELQDNAVSPDGVSWELYGNGTRPWNRFDAMVVDVSEDDQLSISATDLTCEDGFEYGEDPCYQNLARVGVDDMLMISLGETGHHGSYATIEIDVAAPSGPVARACLFPYTDFIQYNCPAWETVDCAVSGAVVVSSLAGLVPLSGDVDLLFASGARIHGVFVAE